MARHLRGAHRPPVDYQGMDLTAFGCATCPTCEVAYVSGAELTAHLSTCERRRQGADAEVGASGAQRQERPVDPVIVEASWEWLPSESPALGGLCMPIFLCSACRAKDEFAGVMRWILRKSDGDSEDFWRLMGVAPRMLLAPLPGATAGCSQLRFEHLDLIFGAGVGVPTIQHAYEQIVSNRIPAGVQPWIMGARLVALLKPGGGVRPIACGEVLIRRLAGKVVCRQMKTRLAVHFGRLRKQVRLRQRPRWGSACMEVRRGGWALRVDPLGEGHSARGPTRSVLHGAPLQPVLREVMRARPEVYIIAYYLDDIHILGEPEQVREAYDTAVPLLADIGLELNVRKSVGGPSGACEVFQDVVDASGVSMPAAVVPLEGIRVLGIPVGSEAWVADQCFVMASTAGAILPKLARLNDPQEVAGSPYPLGEEAAALSQLPTRWGGLGLTSAQQLAPAGWLGSLAHVWKRVVVMFPSVRGLLPHLGAPEGTDAGGHPLVAGLVSAMEDVLGVRERVLAARAEGHVLPEALKVPEEPPRCGGVVDEFGYHYLACNRMGMFTDLPPRRSAGCVR
eukprot:gene34039-biopygen5797